MRKNERESLMAAKDKDEVKKEETRRRKK